MEELTKENYKDNHDYLSYSRISRFLRCEWAAYNNYHEPTTVAQLAGSYVDAYFSGELDEFKDAHPEIFNSRTGELKSGFQNAADYIQRAESDEEFMKYLTGEKQKIMTGEIGGVKFKIKMDFYVPDERIVDLKLMKDFNKVWSDNYRAYVNFIQAYDYDIELAIFQEIVYQNTGKKLPCIIAAITKETPSDLGLFEIPQAKLDKALDFVKQSLPRIKGIIEGKIKPNRCEKCSYCRMTKRVKLISADYAGLSGDELREVGINF